MEKPEKTKKFHNTLASFFNKIKRRETIIIVSDFDAETKKRNNHHRQNNIIVKYAKLNLNINGEKLIELFDKHQQFLQTQANKPTYMIIFCSKQQYLCRKNNLAKKESLL